MPSKTIPAFVAGIVPALVLPAMLMLNPFTHLASAAQPPRQLPAAELKRAVERLSVVGSVLYVAAHPDDENTRLLSYFVNDKLLRTGYLALTRGDGGQNLIGSEQGPLLGLIRTQELLAARRVDGATQLFTRARDFGYSKTATETLAIWGKDDILGDVVWAIRKFRPDVIVTRFPPVGGDTHGHHTASAMLVLEAFRLAADPSYKPEQLKFVSVWQAKRILWNKGVFNAKPNEDFSAFFKLDTGRYNPALGLSYGEMAATSRSMHKSQGFGAATSRGPALEYFQVLAGEPVKDSIFDGVDQTWKRVPGSEKVAALFKQAEAQFHDDAPDAIIPILLAADAALISLVTDSPTTDAIKTEKQRELRNLIAECAGLHAEINAADFSVVPGADLPISISVVNRSHAGLRLKEIRFAGGPTIPVDEALASNEPFTLDRALPIPASMPISQPYWLEETPQKGLYPVTDPSTIGMPELAPTLRAEFVLSDGASSFGIERAVFFKWTDPVIGERFRNVEIVPPVMVNTSSATLLFPERNRKRAELRVTLIAGRAGVSGTLRITSSDGEKMPAVPASVPFKLGAKGSEQEFTFSVAAPQIIDGKEPWVRPVAEVDGQSFSRGLLRIEHAHIPIQTLFPDATVRCVSFDLKRGAKHDNGHDNNHLGYIAGAGDEVPQALRQVGYEVTLLDEQAIANKPLSSYDAIITGVRAWNVNPRLAALHGKLMDYVAGGGTLLVQYNTNNRLSKIQGDLGPYPLEISQDRVTDENATMQFENAKDSIWQKPNALTPDSFANWVQERGLYFAGKWDEHYQTPLSMHDPNEPPSKGSILIAKHGKGTFIYTGLAFFRQLPAGVPSAFQLFANLLAYGK